MQADRRRINGPTGGTAPPIFSFTDSKDPSLLKRPTRTRADDEHRKIFLRTGVVPSASGSAYFEIPPQTSSELTSSTPAKTLIPHSSNLKLTCTVHGPRPLPRNAAFSPNLLVSTHVKFAPFASRQRRGYVRDAVERDLGVHLETALRGVVIGERWPKSAAEVVITILEGEDDGWWGDALSSTGQNSANNAGKAGGWGLMGVLAGCISVAGAALVDAGIDCVDLISGGVAAAVVDSGAQGGMSRIVVDPAPAEHEGIAAASVVGYLQSRDEVTEMWIRGDAGDRVEVLVDHAVQAASLTRVVVADAVKEATELKLAQAEAEAKPANGQIKGFKEKDVNMTG